MAIILIIAVPLVMQSLNNAKNEAFKLNAKLLIHAIELKASEDSAFDPTTVDATNIKDLLKLDDSNYESVLVSVTDNLIEIEIVGKNKWEGLTATGSTKGILVSKSGGGGETPNDGANGNLVKTADGGYIIVGSTESSDGDIPTNKGGLDVFVMKFSAIGTLSWTKTYGGSWDEQSNSIIRTTDGGYMIAGWTDSIDGDMNGLVSKGDSDAFLLKITSVGNVEWIKKYGGSQSEDDVSVVQTEDGGYLMSSTTNSNDGDINYNNGTYDIWVVKVNQTGTIQWSQNYGGSKDDYNTKLIKASDGGYILAGQSYSKNGDFTDGNAGYQDAFLIKISETGTLVWSKTYGGSNGDPARSVLKTPDGGYLLICSSDSIDGDINNPKDQDDWDDDIWIVKVTSTGIIQWEKMYGGTEDEEAVTAINTIDGGYLLLGNTISNDGDITTPARDSRWDMWVLKISSNGTKIWDKTVGIDMPDSAADIRQNSDGSYVIIGTAAPEDEANVVFTKLTSNGEKLFSNMFGGTSHEYMGPYHHPAFAPVG